MATRQEVSTALAAILDSVSANPDLLDDEMALAISELTSQVTQWMQRDQGGAGGEPLEPQEPPVTTDQQETLEMLWHISGGDPAIFTQYLSSYPDPEIQQIIRSPAVLQNLLAEFSNVPPKIPQVSDGIPEADINSSNVFGFRYDPKAQRLLVKFNGKDVKASGPVYSYDGVPQDIAQIFAAGAIPAKTNGKNKFGRWWISKTPSLGASAYELLQKGGFPYRRISG